MKAKLYFKVTATRTVKQQYPRVQQYVMNHRLEVTGKFYERSKVGYPSLDKALAAPGLLILSNVDRCIKSVPFLERLRGIDFQVVGNENFCPNTLEALLANAQEQKNASAAKISNSLKELVAQGVKIGAAAPGHDHTNFVASQGWKHASKKRAAKAKDYYKDIMPIIRALRANGVTQEGVAETLNEQGYTTSRGGPFYPIMIARLEHKYVSPTEV